jgi:hypothetical protein
MSQSILSDLTAALPLVTSSIADVGPRCIHSVRLWGWMPVSCKRMAAYITLCCCLTRLMCQGRPFWMDWAWLSSLCLRASSGESKSSPHTSQLYAISGVTASDMVYNVHTSHIHSPLLLSSENGLSELLHLKRSLDLELFDSLFQTSSWPFDSCCRDIDSHRSACYPSQPKRSWRHPHMMHAHSGCNW